MFGHRENTWRKKGNSNYHPKRKNDLSVCWRNAGKKKGKKSNIWVPRLCFPGPTDKIISTVHRKFKIQNSKTQNSKKNFFHFSGSKQKIPSCTAQKRSDPHLTESTGTHFQNQIAQCYKTTTRTMKRHHENEQKKKRRREQVKALTVRPSEYLKVRRERIAWKVAMNLRWALKSPSLGPISRLRNPRRKSRERERRRSKRSVLRGRWGNRRAERSDVQVARSRGGLWR